MRRARPNVFLSPHIACVTAAAEPRFVDLMVHEVLRVSPATARGSG
jgi:phosphoglycerate dehydrogenase-like enzyme